MFNNESETVETVQEVLEMAEVILDNYVMKFRTSPDIGEEIVSLLATVAMGKLENNMVSKESLDFTKPMRMDHTMYLLFEILTTMMPVDDLVPREFTNGYRGARDLVLHLAVKIHETIIEKEAQSNV